MDHSLLTGLKLNTAWRSFLTSHLGPHKLRQVLGINPRRANASGDSVLGDLRRLRRLKQRHVAGIFRVGRCHLPGDGKLSLHVAGQVFVYRFKESGFGISTILSATPSLTDSTSELRSLAMYSRLGYPNSSKAIARASSSVSARSGRRKRLLCFWRRCRESGNFVCVWAVLFQRQHPCGIGVVTINRCVLQDR